MTFAHAKIMHRELAEQNIFGGDCFATSLDSILEDRDLPDGFCYDILNAQREQNRLKYEEAIRKQVAKHFRADHYAYSLISDLSVYFAPDGNPLNWRAPSDPYEVVPPELKSWIREYALLERERVYELLFDGESEEGRTERADSALADAYERLGMFVVARNIILDGASLIPVHTENAQGDTHVFAVTQNGIDNLHVIDSAFPEDTDENYFKPLIRSPHLDLEWLCDLESFNAEKSETLNQFGNPFTRITDSNIPVDEEGSTWKYAVYPVPPQK